MSCFFKCLKTGVIFGTGVYTGVYCTQHYEIVFGTGVYAGVYIAQNYQIDKVENPKMLFEKAQAYIKEKLEGAGKKDK